MNKQTRNTLILALALLLLLAGAWAITGGGADSAQIQAPEASDGAAEPTELLPGLYASVEQHGQEPLLLPLWEDTVILLHDTEEAFNIVCVQDGTVFVADANCGDLTCVKMGAMQTRGDFIACLPHGLFVYVVEVTA